jgi:PKD repeat protein
MKKISILFMILSVVVIGISSVGCPSSATAKGSLNVQIEPLEVRQLGAQWSVDGGSWHTSGETVSGLAAGNHTVLFSQLTAWSAPSPQTISVLANNTAETIGTYEGKERPSAAFLAVPSAGTAPLNVQFTDKTLEGDAEVTAWSWDFGDGTTSRKRNPSHVYRNQGEYTVKLTATSAIDSDTITKYEFVVVKVPHQSIYNSAVIIVDQTSTLNLVDVGENYLTFSATGSAPFLDIGNVLVGSQGEGFLRVVTNVTNDTNTVLVTTELASLTDVFEQADIEGTIYFTPETLAKAGVPLKGWVCAHSVGLRPPGAGCTSGTQVSRGIAICTVSRILCPDHIGTRGLSPISGLRNVGT